MGTGMCDELGSGSRGPFAGGAAQAKEQLQLQRGKAGRGRGSPGQRGALRCPVCGGRSEGAAGRVTLDKGSLL